MTLKSLGASTVGAWAAALLQRARGAVIGLALTGIIGVLAAHLALAMSWTSRFQYALWVMGSLALYALALAIGHVGNARELPLSNPGRPSTPRHWRLTHRAHQS